MYQTTLYFFSSQCLVFCVLSKVVNTVPVPAGMYCTDMYTDIETSTFRTNLNTGRTGHNFFFFLNF